MRILLDECFPKRLKRTLPGHEVRTVPEMGWSGKHNGELLRTAAAAFDVLVTVDRNLPHQQILEAFEIRIVVLKARSNRIEHLAPLMPHVLHALETLQPKQYVVIGG